MLHGFFLSLIVVGAQGSTNKSWRNVLLDEAKLRTSWYFNETLLEEPHVKDRVTLRLLKEDKNCAGQDQPVFYFEFNVSARPVDVFNMLVIDPLRDNPCAHAESTSAGEFRKSGLRAWSVVTKIPILGHMEFVQWEVVDANVAEENFWLLASTLENDKLEEKYPLVKGAIDADVCLASYQIYKNPDGTAHVIGTRHMNMHFFNFIPMHMVLDHVPAAWEIIIKCVEGLRTQSVAQMANGWSKSELKIPDWMLHSSDEGDLDLGFDVKARGGAEEVAFREEAPTGSFVSYPILGAIVAFALLCMATCFCCCRRGQCCVTKAGNGHDAEPSEISEPFWGHCWEMSSGDESQAEE